MKDYKKPPFRRSRRFRSVVKPLPSTLASSQSVPEHSSWRPNNLARSDPSSSSQIPPIRSAVSNPSNSSSVSLVQNNVHTAHVHIPRSSSNKYLNEAPIGRLTTYGQNYPPGGPSSLASTRPVVSDIQRDTMQNADHDMAPAIFLEPPTRISLELPTASHQDPPSFVSDLPETTNPSQPCTPQPSE
jgi:hypothetical protein